MGIQPLSSVTVVHSRGIQETESGRQSNAQKNTVKDTNGRNREENQMNTGNSHPPLKSNRDIVSYRISGNTEEPPKAVLLNPSTGQAKPLIPQNPRMEQAVCRQIQAAKDIVENPPPQSPIPQAVDVTV